MEPQWRVDRECLGVERGGGRLPSQPPVRQNLWRLPLFYSLSSAREVVFRILCVRWWTDLTLCWASAGWWWREEGPAWELYSTTRTSGVEPTVWEECAERADNQETGRRIVNPGLLSMSQSAPGPTLLRRARKKPRQFCWGLENQACMLGGAVILSMRGLVREHWADAVATQHWRGRLERQWGYSRGGGMFSTRGESSTDANLQGWM